MSAPLRAGIVGLGIMGSAYAKHLLAAGFAVLGYDPDAAARARFERLGGQSQASPRAVTAGADVVLTALASLEALDAAYFGPDGIAAAGRAGLVVVDTGTFALDAKERVRAALEARGASVLDVPVSGTGAQAQQRDLTLLASGDAAAFERVRPLLEAYARDVRFVGAFGSGSKLKYIANLLVTIHNLSAAEAVVLAERAGIDPAMMLEVLGTSAASSRMLQVRGPMMVEGRYEPAAMKVAVHQKDISIIEDFSRSVGAPTPLFSHSAAYYDAAAKLGHGEHDTASLAEVLRADARGETR